MTATATDAPPVNAPLNYILHLADSALVLGQRNAEWCGHGPVLEEDIALANISLDLVGQARLLYQHAATLQGGGATEDTLAYFRGADAFRNYTLLELPHGLPVQQATGNASGDAQPAPQRDYAVTIVRNFLYSALMVLLWDALRQSQDTQLAAIAERSLKETRYHLRHSRDWLIRLGDGTADSHARTQAALDYLVPYAAEFWMPFASTKEANYLYSTGACVEIDADIQANWRSLVRSALQEATLVWPQRQVVDSATLPQGKNGVHSAHLAPLLQDMQSLARQHPEAVW